MKHFRVFSIAVLFGLTVVAGTVAAHEWKAPEEAAELHSPLPVNEVHISAGKTLYLQYCASCHGVDMQGMTGEAAGLDKAAPDLIKNLKLHSEGGFFWKIREGRGDMPGFKEALTDDEIWSIITAIKQAVGEK